MKDDFNRKVKKQFHLRAENFEKSANWITDSNLLAIHKRMAKTKRNNLVLDLCCGTGVVGSQFNNKVKMVLGVDLSKDMLKQASSRIKFCINAEASRLPFRNKTFDVVVCRQALHFIDIKKLAEEIKRICKPKARIVVSQIVPFNKKDKDWLYQIHSKKQPLLKNFLLAEDIIGFVRKTGCKNLKTFRCCIIESINKWLGFSPELTPAARRRVKKLFRTAPPAYKKIHATRFIRSNIAEKMSWIIVRGIKSLN